MDLLQQSFIEVLNQTISKTPKISNRPLKRGYAASIGMENINKNGNTHKKVIMIYNKAFLMLCCKELLGEDIPSNEAMADMAKEYANLTIGHAKVIAEGSNMHFNIATPQFLGVKLIKDAIESKHFNIGAARCSIYMETN